MTDPTSESLFAQWLDGRARGETIDFESFCLAHPEHAEGLHHLRGMFGKFDEVRRAIELEQSSWTDHLEKIRRLGAPTERYARGDEIGRGGMGSVHQVVDHLLERSLAMKVLGAGIHSTHSLTPRSDDRSLGRFLEEALITARLDHPYIVPVHDLGLDAQGRVYFAMKRVNGEDLRKIFDRIREGVNGWTTTRGLQIVLKVCEAMAYAHAKQIVHRDLKPANVMVGPFGEVYVMDWGLARLLDRPDTKDVRIRPEASADLRSPRRERQAESPAAPLVTMDGDVVGTPSYMPLEQAEGNLAAIGPRADVYAIGAMLYHLVSGHPPYVGVDEAITPRIILDRVKARSPRPLHELAPEAPAELIAIIEKAMARDANNRYADMKTLAADLQAYLDVRVVSAYETGAIAELKKWVQRNPALATAAVALMLVLAGATAIVTQQNLEVEAKNVEVTQQKNFAEARKAEFDQLAGRVFLERAIEREKDLYPAWPEKIPAIETWLATDVNRLLVLKPILESTLADLRTRSLSITDDEREHDRTTHPKFSELESLRHRLAWLRTAIGARASSTPPQVPSLPPDLESKTALELGEFAWKRVDANSTTRVIGEEGLALAAARRAVEKIDAGDTTAELAVTLDTLKWACVSNGLVAEARAASDRALDTAPDEQKAYYRSYRENLERLLTDLSGEAGAKALLDRERQVTELEKLVNVRRTYTFKLESESFLHAVLTDLATAISAFEAGMRKDVEQRLSWAKSISNLTLHHPNARVTWNDARSAIAKADDVVASKLYAQSPGGPIDLIPQTGLVPIGMNPLTKLWEFYELRSACDVAAGQDPAAIEIPVHREDGSIEVKDGTGIVFVLLPGGTFLQGAQRTNDTFPNFDPAANADERPQDVTLSPFFLARHELTMGQWKRLAGNEPSFHTRNRRYDDDPIAIGWNHPVTEVDWGTSEAWLRRFGLTLPTEARWEYAARAGTTTPWWTGREASSLCGAANVLDQRGEAKYPDWGQQIGDFDDGFVSVAPVGHFRANAFGLFDVHGNVWEWCLDAFVNRYGTARAGDGLRALDAANPITRVFRGGAYNYSASSARSADRLWAAPNSHSGVHGIRAARNVTTQ